MWRRFTSGIRDWFRRRCWSPQRRRTRHGVLRLEWLESRQLLAAVLANSAPVNMLPSVIVATQNTALAVTGISISDSDAAGLPVQITLSIAQGQLTLNSAISGGVTGGQIVSDGIGGMTITAPLTAINSTLSAAGGLIYAPKPGFQGLDPLTVISNDLGHTGGQPLVDVDSVAIIVAVPSTSPGGERTVAGTAGDDVLVVSRLAPNIYEVLLNRDTTIYSASRLITTNFGGGGDTLLVNTPDDTAVTLSPGRCVAVGPGFNIDLAEGQSTRVNGYSSSSVVFTSAAMFTATLGNATDSTEGRFVQVAGFAHIYATAKDSTSTATLTDTPADDIFYAAPGTSALYTDGKIVQVFGYRRVSAVANPAGGGNDYALLYDTPGNDYFNSQPLLASMSGATIDFVASGFENVFGFASTGSDVATLYDSTGNDYLYGLPGYTVMVGAGYLNEAIGFDAAISWSSSGTDTAVLYDSAGDDYFYGTTTNSLMCTSSSYNQVFGFEIIYALAYAGGHDQAYINGSSSTNNVFAVGNQFQLALPGLNMLLFNVDRIDLQLPNGSSNHQQAGAIDYVLQTTGVFT